MSEAPRYLSIRRIANGFVVESNRSEVGTYAASPDDLLSLVRAWAIPPAPTSKKKPATRKA